LVGQYEHIENDQHALLRLRAGNFDPHRTVILSEQPATQPQSDSTAQAAITSYDLHKIVIETTSRFPQILVLSDNYYPICWQAFVDDKPVKTLRANHAFAAIEVAPGEHRVEFRYSSPALTTGAAASVSALLVALACIVLGWRKEKRTA
jgi:uncharacterized membrane protein YfhO